MEKVGGAFLQKLNKGSALIINALSPKVSAKNAMINFSAN